MVFRTNNVIVLIAIFLLAAFIIAFAGKMCMELQYEIRTGIEEMVQWGKKVIKRRSKEDVTEVAE